MKTLSFSNWVNENTENDQLLLRQLGITELEFDFRSIVGPIKVDVIKPMLNSAVLSNGQMITKVSGWSRGSDFAIRYYLTDGNEYLVYVHKNEILVSDTEDEIIGKLSRSEFSEIVKRNRYILLACAQVISNCLRKPINESAEDNDPLILRQLGIQELEFNMRYGTGNAFDDNDGALVFTDYDTDESFCSNYVRQDGEMMMAVSGFVQSFKMDVDVTFTDGSEFGFSWNADDSWSKLYVISAINRPGEPRSIVSTATYGYDDLDTLATNGLGLMANIIKLATQQIASITGRN